jgi:hypothetical protein
MDNFAGRLDAELKAAGLDIIGVSIGSNTDTATWRVQPSALQAQAQPIIDAVNLEQWAIDEQFSVLRVERNHRLTVSDWTHMSDVTISSETLSAWAAYRQALRDLPATTGDLAHPVWPTEPAGAN